MKNRERLSQAQDFSRWIFLEIVSIKRDLPCRIVFLRMKQHLLLIGSKQNLQVQLDPDTAAFASFSYIL
jgi:hypothetical protein